MDSRAYSTSCTCENSNPNDPQREICAQNSRGTGVLTTPPTHSTLIHGSTLHTGTRFHTPHWYTVPHTSTGTRFHTLHWYTVPHSALLECPWAVPCLTDNTALQSL